MATTKRTKTTNKPSLKSQGAGYSTTNRKGETTYYKSSKDAPGYTDTFQGKGTMSKGNAPISRVDSKGAVLATNIGTTSPVIPPKPQVPDTGDMLGMNNASVLQEGLTLDGGKFVKDESASDVMNATKEANANMGNIASQVLGYLQPQENQMQNAYEDTYGISEKQAQRDLRRAERDKQRYTTELNAITTNRDAAILALEDTGRGQTTGFIGGEQGRIQRQAAIAALPVQAQLAAAQGDLEIAKSHVDSLFQMKIKDIETEQAYKQTVANTWMSVANTQQSNLLNAAIADSNARAAEKSQALAMANDWAKMAIEYGQTSLAGKMMKLDPTSKTFQQDLAALQGQVVKPMSAKAPTIQTINGVDMQWDPTTGTWVTPTGAGAPGTTPMSSQKTQTLNDIDTLLQNSESKLSEFLGKRNIIQRNIPGTEEYQFTVQHENLINQLALAARGELKGQGQVSDYEGKLLKSAQTTLNLYMEPKAYLKEAKQVRGAIQTSSGIPAYVSIKSPDGSQTKYAVLDSQSIQDAVNQGYVVEYQ